MERTVPHPVPRTVRTITVTSLREPVWVVSLVTREVDVLRVSELDSHCKKKNVSCPKSCAKIRSSFGKCFVIIGHMRLIVYR